MIAITLSALLLLCVFNLQACAQPVNELSGVVVYAHEVRTVRLCGSTQQLWLHAKPERLMQLKSALQKITQQPYQESYIEFTGKMLDEPPGELAREYEGTIEIEQILKLSAIAPDDCN